MARALLNLAILGGLMLGAAYVPSLLGKLPSGKVAGFAVPARSDESSRELRREMADLGSTVADLKALAGGGAKTRHVSGLSEEEREMMRDAAPQLKFRNNALTRSVGLAGGGGTAAALPELPGAAGQVLSRFKNQKGPDFQTFGDFRDDFIRFYRGHQAQAAYALWLVPGAAIALSFLLFLLKRYTLSMLLTGLLFSLTSGVLWMLSASIAFSGVLTRQSLLPALPQELWLSPVIFLVVSAGMLRLADENYPFWNKTVSALAAPIGASLLAAYWPALLAKAKGAIAAKAGA